MAFVLVRHLAPDHKSILSDLVGRYTRMQVCEVEDGIEVQPNWAIEDKSVGENAPAPAKTTG